ncbi:unnamed protein product [Prunus armeniaca]|uniref:Uncharacterized protein n=1 Tax=Prunus armeniaca TaxID=36596 RepID=A0A6J5VP62_PRUAR|nr:unnamed protein product [Prunus armeniaca]
MHNIFDRASPSQTPLPTAQPPHIPFLDLPPEPPCLLIARTTIFLEPSYQSLLLQIPRPPSLEVGGTLCGHPGNLQASSSSSLILKIAPIQPVRA